MVTARLCTKHKVVDCESQSSLRASKRVKPDTHHPGWTGARTASPTTGSPIAGDQDWSFRWAIPTRQLLTGPQGCNLTMDVLMPLLPVSSNNTCEKPHDKVCVRAERDAERGVTAEADELWELRGLLAATTAEARAAIAALQASAPGKTNLDTSIARETSQSRPLPLRHTNMHHMYGYSTDGINALLH